MFEILLLKCWLEALAVLDSLAIHLVHPVHQGEAQQYPGGVEGRRHHARASQHPLVIFKRIDGDKLEWLPYAHPS